MPHKPLPIGIDDFEEVITRGNYYVDKTWFIKELLDKKGKANLLTRPRRFGKTLNLSMLRYFFEKPTDGKDSKYLFEGLQIMDAGDEYVSQQGKYPVIMLTLKSAKQPDFDLSFDRLKEAIAGEFKRHNEILLSDKLQQEDKEKFIALRSRKAEKGDYYTALVFLSQCLYEVYQQKVVLLIDEYDVPLENAYYNGFYDQMIAFIRSLFESVLKTNPYLEFAVITGCLGISKESIFTGLNNPNVVSILSEDYDEYYGFVEEEVRQMLRSYGCEDQMGTMKKWYDGYVFGNTEVYNPWSVINFTYELINSENAFPTAAWSNTSSNKIVRDLIDHASETVRTEVEMLTNGGTIEKKIHEDITYDDIYRTEENLWNFLFFTGYLKQVSKRVEHDELYITFAVPNTEVRLIYVNQIRNWFQDEVKHKDLTALYQAILSGDAEMFQQELTAQLQSTISYMDYSEAFYHGFLLGLFTNLPYVVKSNREAGQGRYDICIYKSDIRIPPVILELKKSETFRKLEATSQAALQQIADKKYDFDLTEEGYSEVICYGVAFFKKQVSICVERRSLAFED